MSGTDATITRRFHYFGSLAEHALHRPD